MGKLIVGLLTAAAVAAAALFLGKTLLNFLEEQGSDQKKIHDQMHPKKRPAPTPNAIPTPKPAAPAAPAPTIQTPYAPPAGDDPYWNGQQWVSADGAMAFNGQYWTAGNGTMYWDGQRWLSMDGQWTYDGQRWVSAYDTPVASTTGSYAPADSGGSGGGPGGGEYPGDDAVFGSPGQA